MSAFSHSIASVQKFSLLLIFAAFHQYPIIMKKMLHLAAALAVSLVLSGQSVQSFSVMKEFIEPENENIVIQPAKTVLLPVDINMIKDGLIKDNTDMVNVIIIGNSANAYSLWNGARTVLWADNQLNTISFVHRMTIPPGVGNLAYAFSTNGGLAWNTNVPLLISPYQASFPQGLIFNPAGNTIPGEAYITFITPTTTPGSYISGIHKLNQTQNPSHQLWTGQTINSNSGFTINPVSGNTFLVTAGMTVNGYSGNLVIIRGVFNAATGQFEYSQTLLPFPAHPQGYQFAPADIKIAFAPDGLVGYISVLWDNMSDPHAGGKAFYPIMIKTTDGGNSWGIPEAVVLGGPDGFSEVKNYLTDAELAAIFGYPVTNRDSLVFTTAYDHGLAIDMSGNPHLGVTIGLALTPYTIFGGNSGRTATFHLFEHKNNQTYHATFVNRNKTFRGTFGELSEDNRTQVSVTQDGSKVFLSWLDTDFEGVTENIMPDIHCWGFDAVTYKFTDAVNVTYFSEAWLEAFMGTSSYYVLSGNGNYTIPFVYQTMPEFNPLNPVDYKYIYNFSFSDSDFTNGPLVPVLLPGDANGDGVVNALDVISTINYILGTGPGGPFVFENADVNGDSIINVMDVTLIINIILSGK